MGAPNAPLSIRLLRYFTAGEPDECWPWTGTISPGPHGGYGRIKDKVSPAGVAGRTLYAHRAVYELLVGPISDGLTLDHQCHNRDASCAGGGGCQHRRCVNPAHLAPATYAANTLAGKSFAASNAAKVVCLRGHDLTDPANLKPNSRGARQCRACVNIGRMERYYAKRAEGLSSAEAGRS